MIASLPARYLLALAATRAPAPDRRAAGGTATGLAPALLGLPVPGPVLGLGQLLVGMGLVALVGMAEPDPPAAVAAVLGSIVLGWGAGGHAIERLRRRMRPAARDLGP